MTPLSMRQQPMVSNNWPSHAWNSTLSRLSLRFFLYAICAYTMVHPVFAENVTRQGNSTEASTNGTEYERPYWQDLWGMWGPETWDCEAVFNETLNHATEFNKVASSAGSTIMALLPSLLAFAPIITARIGLLSNLSHYHGVIAAAFTFGLPVDQLDAITAQSITSVKKLLGDIGDAEKLHGNVEDAKRLLGIVQDPAPTAGDPASPTNLSVPSMPVDAPPTNDLPATENVPKSLNDIVEDALSSIKQKAFDRNRPSIRRVQVMMCLFTFIHLCLFWCLLTIMLSADPSTLIWDCRDARWLTGGLLQGVFCLIGPLRMRFERKGFAATDVIHINKASNASNASNTMQTHHWLSIRNYLSRLRDPHPMIVILQPSAKATSGLNGQGSKVRRGLRVVYFIGISQLCWILFLSFFFSSTIGSSLFWSLLVVWTFVLTVAASRGLSILTIWLVENHLELQVIEYDDLLELEVMRGLIGALPEALVEVRGNPNLGWEKFYLQGQSTGYENGLHKVQTFSFYHIPARELIPMVGAFITSFLIFMQLPQVTPVGILILMCPFVIFSVFNGAEKFIVLCNQGADTGTA